MRVNIHDRNAFSLVSIAKKQSMDVDVKQLYKHN